MLSINGLYRLSTHGLERVYAPLNKLLCMFVFGLFIGVILGYMWHRAQL